MTNLIIYGASGHGKVVYDTAVKSGHEIIIFYDDDVNKARILDQKVSHQLPEMGNVVIAIGNNKVRKKIAAQLKLTLGQYLIHPSSVIASNVQIGPGSVVFAGSVINPDVQIGENVIINTHATIEHDCFVDDFAHISPAATLCGTVQIGEGTHIGAGAVVLPNLKIGKWCTIAAGAVVTKDIPDHSKVVGVPGKIVGLIDA